MLKYVILLIILINVGKAVQAQSYTIESFEGIPQKINVTCDGENLTITCFRDTIHITDFNDFPEGATLLNNNFLKVVYDARGGTGLHLTHTLLLCVNNQKLYQAIHITSVFNEEFIDYSKKVDPANPVAERSRYELFLNLTGSSKEDYKLTIHIHDERKSKEPHRTNYNKNSQTVLKFNKLLNIFYSKYERVSNRFTVFDPKTYDEGKQYVSGNFPVVRLGAYDYYIIKGEWYEKDDHNNLTKYSYK